MEGGGIWVTVLISPHHFMVRYATSLTILLAGPISHTSKLLAKLYWQSTRYVLSMQRRFSLGSRVMRRNFETSDVLFFLYVLCTFFMTIYNCNKVCAANSERVIERSCRGWCRAVAAQHCPPPH